ncbi:hypothetical protein EKO23_20970 [Nocardioides guangzhouensis]|uniref:Sensor domain-containing protein n=1 Tax=Nocardioides guangzhouensis TaxID=2497878 RepID=A0A4Q4Z5Z3_9ACTN|nr:hypothetical protein [Nocardioides guangzhouensis]RYP82765.1 hypothetical protein EKO23_20970 [Nocardioides guangzhouensis]
MPERDPIQELENFTVGGPPVHTLPAAEVRRRGDRMRRRRAVALAGGAALAVAVVVAAPLALAGGGNGGGPDNREPGFATGGSTPTARAASGWLSALPDDFDLAVGYPDTNPDGSPVEVDRDISGSSLAVCGPDVPTGADRVDEAVVKYVAPAMPRSRALQLYADDAAAQAALGNLREAVAACPAPDGDGQVLTPLDWAAGDASYAWTTRSRAGSGFAPGLTVTHVVRVGNALLVATTSDQRVEGPEAVARAEHAAEDETLLAVDDMNVFAEHPGVVSPDGVTDGSDGGPGDGSDGSIATAPGADLPADFPVADGLRRAGAGDGGVVTDPSREAAGGVGVLAPCDAAAWPVTARDRLAVRSTGPEMVDARELVTFTDATEAAGVLSALRQAVESCPRQETSDGTLLLDPQEVHGLGHDHVAFFQHSDQGLGGTYWMFVRVGRAVLATSYTGETSSTTLPQLVDEQKLNTDPLVARLCRFAEAGC